MSSEEDRWVSNANIYEYGSAANPPMAPIPVLEHSPKLHKEGETRIIPFETNVSLNIESKCTSPNLMASFIRICIGDTIVTNANATSQSFYVIRGNGVTSCEHGEITWNTGDLFVIPYTDGKINHKCINSKEYGGAALYWVHDEPLMNYLGVKPIICKFEPTLFKREQMISEIENISNVEVDGERNRLGVLLGNKACEQTKTLTHVLWSLLNTIPPNTIQRPHRHNSVALDLAISADSNVYTLMGKEIDSNGEIINPIRCNWQSGGVFITPAGWWHSHHNDSNETAWVLPMQDAGLYTHQRTLDIRFVDDEIELHRNGKIRGSTLM